MAAIPKGTMMNDVPKNKGKKAKSKKASGGKLSMALMQMMRGGGQRRNIMGMM